MNFLPQRSNQEKWSSRASRVVRAITHDQNGNKTPASAYMFRLLFWSLNVVGACMIPFIAHLGSSKATEVPTGDVVGVAQAVLFFSCVNVLAAAFRGPVKHPKLAHSITTTLLILLCALLIVTGVVTYALASRPLLRVSEGIWWWVAVLGTISLIAEAFVAMLDHDVLPAVAAVRPPD